MIRSRRLAAFAIAAAAFLAPAASAEVVVIRAGTAHIVAEGRVIEGGVSILVRNGRIQEIGEDVTVPPGARVVDYGPASVVIPGLVAVSSTFTSTPSPRTAAPGLLAIDEFDPYSSLYLDDVTAGVTTLYLNPPRTRLIGGQGAVVKLGSGEGEDRVLSASASIHGSISKEARSTGGFWEPPVPATVDVGLGVYERQLPRTTMGAIVALDEIIDAARSGRVEETYGAETTEALKPLLDASTPWRMFARTEAEISALLRWAGKQEVPLILEGARDAGPLSTAIAEAGVRVIVEVDYSPNSSPRTLGKDIDAVWPVYDTAAQLVEVGVPIAISTNAGTRARDLRFAASLASRGGLDPATALRAITLGAAEILGVASRVGSLTPGKDADFVILNGPPLSASSSVIATWIDGDTAWSAAENDSVVVAVDELHVGDGTILRPGQLLLRDGKIEEVGAIVSHPAGAAVVRGPVAVPGMIDALGHLGLEGSTAAVAADYDLSQILEPGDHADRRVARAGITTVALSPRGSHASGAPMMAYKPASQDVDDMVVRDSAAVRVKWSDRNRLKAGRAVRELLGKAVDYRNKWIKYEAELAEWVPPPVEAADEDEDDDDKKKDEKGDDDEKKEEKDSKSKKKSKKGKKGKKGKDEDEGDPLTGVWETSVVVPPFVEETKLRMRIEFVEAGSESGPVKGSVRCDALSEDLIELSGTFDDDELDVSGRGTRGTVNLAGEIKKGKLEGSIQLGEVEVELEAERTAKELRYAKLPERRREKVEKEKPPKGKPKEPKTDSKLEVLRRAIDGRVAVIVEVDREDEILECVDAFEAVGIRPVLLGASQAFRVLDEIRGRIDGILPSHRIHRDDGVLGRAGRAFPYAEIVAAGIPVAFHSSAEEGASELPLIASYAVSQGLSPARALSALSGDAAAMLKVDDRVGLLRVGMDADVLLLDGPPLEPSTRVLRTWVNGREVR